MTRRHSIVAWLSVVPLLLAGLYGVALALFVDLQRNPPGAVLVHGWPAPLAAGSWLARRVRR